MKISRIVNKKQKILDEEFMRLALDLAKKGRGKTSPNPMVGAVVVNNGKVVGAGYHKKAGSSHAEINALKAAGSKAIGATLYVTLEPCSGYGRTPPCVNTIVKNGIRRVVIASKDKNPVNRGKGVTFIRNNKIKVDIGVLKKESEELNKWYNKYIQQGIPFVTVKVAMSLDGKIATRTGSSKWITSAKTRRYARSLRKEADAVLIGKNTYIKDSPRFNGVKNKIVLGKIRGILKNGSIERNIITAGRRNCGAFYVPSLNACKTGSEVSTGRGNWLFIDRKKSLKSTLRFLAKCGTMHVLVEGGGEIISSLICEKLVDRVCIFIAPKIIGGRDAITPVEGKGIDVISKAYKVRNMQVQRIGGDILLTGDL